MEEIVKKKKKRKGNELVTVTNPKTGYVSSYSMDIRLKRNLDEKVIAGLDKKDKDYVVVVDGEEGAGKSTFALQMAKYVDNSLDLSRVVFSADDFRNAVLSAKKGQAVVYDEGFTGFSSRSSLSPVNKVLVSLMMQIRQKNLFIVIVLPTVFMLDRYLAQFRTKNLIHVYEVKGNRGYFAVYNKKLKKLVLLKGKKTMSYPKEARTKFRGRFYGKFALGDDKMDKMYRYKKAKALEDEQKNPMTAGQAKYKEQRDICIYALRKSTKMIYKELANYLDEWDLGLSLPQIQKICAKYGDDDRKDMLIKEKEKELAKKEKELAKKEKEAKQIAEIEANSVSLQDIEPKSLDNEQKDDNLPDIEPINV